MQVRQVVREVAGSESTDVAQGDTECLLSGAH
jgi:hypothetical protein